MQIALDLPTVEGRRFRAAFMTAEPIMQLFDVAGMTCGHCVRAVTEAVQRVDPAATVQIDLKARQARVESTALGSRLEDAIREAGYEVHMSAAA